MEKSPWDQLTDEEQKIVAAKLLANGETAQDAFTRRFKKDDAIETAALVITVKNLLDNVGARSNNPVWQQIINIDGGWVGSENREAAAIQITVKGSKAFLDSLRQSGEYDVDQSYEKINFTGHHKHSARFITKTSHQPGMHFVQEETYADDRFDVHWDRRSSAFRELGGRYRFVARLIGAGAARLLEQFAAGLTHNRPLTAAQVRQELYRSS